MPKQRGNEPSSSNRPDYRRGLGGAMHNRSRSKGNVKILYLVLVAAGFILLAWLHPAVGLSASITDILYKAIAIVSMLVCVGGLVYFAWLWAQE